MENLILKSIRPVIKGSRFVKINEAKLSEFCSDFKIKEGRFWLDAVPFEYPKIEKAKELNFLFVLASLVFCFWGKPKWRVKYKGKFYDGSWGLIAALVKAIEKGFPILNFEYLKRISERDLKEIFKGNIEIPLFEERLKILRENGEILVKKFNGNLENLIRKSGGDALKLLEIITSNFPSFNDFSLWKGHKVFFHKRAQVFIGDIHHHFKEKFELKNIEKLTALADYKIPQILRKLEILKYSPILAEKVDNEILIPAGSEEEVEIRANTIWVIELIKKEVKKRIPDITARDIDSHLWLLSQKKTLKDKPYHLTRTIFY